MWKDNFDHPFHLAMITGASSGIGAELARTLARQGIPLWLLGQHRERLQEVKEECALCVPVITDLLNLSDQENLSLLLEKIKTYTPDLVVNNAGFGLYGHSILLPLDKQREMLHLNTRAVMEISIVVGKTLYDLKKPGVIVNISSVAGSYSPFPLGACYAATKAFVTSFSKSLDYELKPFNIRVLANCPGPVNTPFAARASQGTITKVKKTKAISCKKAVDEILWQIAKAKRQHMFTFRYRFLRMLRLILPDKFSSRLIEKALKSRVPASFLLPPSMENR